MRSSRLVLGTIAVAVAAGLLGCSSAAPPPPAPPAPTSPAARPADATYRDPTHKFAIAPPAGWQVGAGQPASAVTFVLPTPDNVEGQPVQVNMSVVITPAEGDLEQNVTAAKQQLPNVMPSYQQVTDDPMTLPGGLAARLLGATFTQQVKLQNLQLVALAAGQLYVVTATAPADDFSRYEPAIRQSFMTFTLL